MSSASFGVDEPFDSRLCFLVCLCGQRRGSQELFERVKESKVSVVFEGSDAVGEGRLVRGRENGP
jgi:hypothetical protein